MITITGHTDSPKDYNRTVCDVKSTSGCGCVTSWACLDCGAINTDSLCLCMGVFTCQSCGKEDAAEMHIPLPVFPDIETILLSFGKLSEIDTNET